MLAVLYDLETSDRLPIGQILNYAFVVVNQKLDIVDKLTGEIRLSRLQLPDPEAIAANRIDVQELQGRASDNELHAAKRIFDFLSKLRADNGGKICLTGFNSAKFDLGYLRTTMIRNGLNPYFSGLTYGDLLHGVRSLYLRNDNFAELMRAHPTSDQKLSFRLENCAHALALLEGRQAHSSYDDVILTLELVREIRRRYKFDLLAYNGYEGSAFHSSLKKGVIVQALDLEYDIKLQERWHHVPYTLLDANDNAALWINLKRYAEKPGRESVQWLRNGSAAFFVDTQSRGVDKSTIELAAQARQELQKVNLRNFFEETSCDIELHIYRLDFDARALLELAIHGHDRAPLRASKNRDLQQLYRRFLLANYEFTQGKTDVDMWARLKAYAEWRYGGKMQINKTGEATEYANSLDNYIKRADALAKQQSELSAVMDSLLNLYGASDIYSCCSDSIVSPEAQQVIVDHTASDRRSASA